MSDDRFEPVRSLFVRRWGEMAASWGISRTMAEIHALLFLATEPLCTDDIMDRLAVSRGSASTNLRQLVNWGLIQRIHQKNDRREYFEAEKDVWQMFETITRERRRREIEPIVETIERCLQMVEKDRGKLSADQKSEADAYQKRFADILEFFGMMNTLFNAISRARASEIRLLAAALKERGAGGAGTGPAPRTRK